MGAPDASGRRCAVLGDPIFHSLSPVLHRAGYEALGLAWTYDAHRVPAGGLPAFLDGLSPDGLSLDGLDDSWRGLSLTMPLKREAVGLVDRLTDRARLAGAVNTIVIDGGVRLGDNTDLPGAVAAIREHTTTPLASATVLGGGATATSIGLALIELGVTSVRLLVRDEARAAETSAALTAHPAAPAVIVAPLDADGVLAADILVSTIPAEAQTDVLVARCARVPVVFEALYEPWPTPLARAVGDRVLVSGLDLLVHQAVLQFELFTGQQAPLEAMRTAGRNALAGRMPA
ncbi:MAG: shikimate dehydrogenase [Nocardioides sp.]|nr:shikimate dehydrogenase [Nocardioides sp.]